MWADPRKLRPWGKNPRRNDGEPVRAVMESIKRFGFGAPIVARKATREVIAGHTRLKAALKLGLSQVPVRYLDISERDAQTLALADNRLGELAEWDEPALAELLQGLKPDEQLLVGWDSRDVDELLAEVSAHESVELTEDEVPEPPKVPVTQPGGVWLLGRHRLVCGDCRSTNDVARVCDGARVNLAFTSPPYASQRKYDESSGFKPIHPDEYVAWFEPVQANVRGVLADDGSWFVNIKEHCDDGQRSLYVKDLTIAHVRQWDWRFVDELCWVHHGFPGQVVDRFKNAWEPIFHFAQSYPAKCRPLHVAYESDTVMQYDKDARQSMTGAGWQGAKEPERVPGMALPRNVLQLSNGATTSIKGHSATFPVALPTFFIRAYSDEGDTALDPFMGSGTTLIAAEQLGRTCYGIELSPAYCDVIVERWQRLTGDKARRA